MAKAKTLTLFVTALKDSVKIDCCEKLQTHQAANIYF